MLVKGQDRDGGRKSSDHDNIDWGTEEVWADTAKKRMVVKNGRDKGSNSLRIEELIAVVVGDVWTVRRERERAEIRRRGCPE